MQAVTAVTVGVGELVDRYRSQSANRREAYKPIPYACTILDLRQILVGGFPDRMSDRMIIIAVDRRSLDLYSS